MARMVRKQICIDDETDARLEALAKELGMSQGAVVRMALRRELGAADRHAAWKRSLERLEAWGALGPVEGGRTWTREDAYDDE